MTEHPVAQADGGQGSRRRLPPLIRAARPHQWIKNVLVVAGPLAYGAPVASAAVAVLIAFVCFCLAASGIYMINDVLDRDADRQHPRKRLRPIAAGELSVRTAVVTGAIALVVSPVLALITGRWQLAVLMVVYEVIQLAYCVWLKHVVVVDLCIVASGFLLRAIAGGLSAHIPLSPWFLLVAAFGSLFMVAGKRYSEMHLLGEGVDATRRSLQGYSASYLRFVWGMAGSATLTFYSLWAFSLVRDNPLWAELSVAPFVVALLRYAVDIDRGAAGEPEDVVLGDRVLQVIGLLWLTCFVISVVTQS